jgi:hypothetical protein
MSDTSAHMANLLYVLSELMRTPEKVRMSARAQYDKWDGTTHHYEHNFMAIVVATGLNPDLLNKQVPTAYIVGTGWGKSTVTPIALKDITSIRRLTRAGGQILWKGADGVTGKDQGKSLAELLAM